MTDWESFYNRFREPDFIPGYEIQNRLGGGAFGEVYKARKTSIDKPYAIKFLKLEEEAQRELVERELEQVRLFAAVDHPHLSQPGRGHRDRPVPATFPRRAAVGLGSPGGYSGD